MPDEKLRAIYLPQYKVAVNVPSSYTDDQIDAYVAKNRGYIEQALPQVQNQARYETFVNRPDPAWNTALGQYQQKYLASPTDGSTPNQLLQQIQNTPGTYERLDLLNKLSPNLSEVGKAAILRQAEQNRGTTGASIGGPPTPAAPNLLQRGLGAAGDVLSFQKDAIAAAVQPLDFAAKQKFAGLHATGDPAIDAQSDFTSQQDAANMGFLQRLSALRGQPLNALAQPMKQAADNQAGHTLNPVGQAGNAVANLAGSMVADPLTWETAGLGTAFSGLAGRAAEGSLAARALAAAPRIVSGGFAAQQLSSGVPEVLQGIQNRDVGQVTQGLASAAFGGLAGLHAGLGGPHGVASPVETDSAAPPVSLNPLRGLGVDDQARLPVSQVRDAGQTAPADSLSPDSVSPGVLAKRARQGAPIIDTGAVPADGTVSSALTVPPDLDAYLQQAEAASRARLAARLQSPPVVDPSTVASVPPVAPAPSDASFLPPAARSAAETAPTPPVPLPAPVQAPGASVAVPPLADPGAGVAFTADNTPVSFRYAAVPSGDLVTSHLDQGTGLALNPSYDQSLQPRDRARVASLAQVAALSGNLNPDRLGVSPLTSDGAPIVGPDMQVESGNARTLALGRHLAAGDPSNYGGWLASNAERFGVDPAQVQQMQSEGRNPVLVRVRSGEVAPEARGALAAEMGRSPVAAFSDVETATSDAQALRQSGALSLFRPQANGEVTGAGNAEFNRAFVRAAVPPEEHGSVLQADGSLSAAGARRAKAAMLAAAYDDPGTLNRLLESTDDNVKGVARTLTEAAPRIALLQDAIAKGERYPLDPADDLTAAANKLSHLRDRGQRVDDYLSQGSLLAEHDLSETGREFLRIMEENKRAPRKLAAVVHGFLDVADAAGSPHDLSMFEDITPPDKLSVLATAERLTNGKTGTLDFESGSPNGPATDGTVLSGEGTADASGASGAAVPPGVLAKRARAAARSAAQAAESPATAGAQTEGVDWKPTHTIGDTPVKKNVLAGADGYYDENGQRVKATKARPAVPLDQPSLDDRLAGVEQDASARLRSRLGRMNSGLDPQDLADLAIIGAAKLARGVVKFSAWSAQMVQEFGENIRPHLDAIWQASLSHHDSEIAPRFSLPFVSDRLAPESPQNARADVGTPRQTPETPSPSNFGAQRPESGKSPAGFAGNINLDNLNTPEEVKSHIQDTARKMAAQIEQARGGRIPMAETEQAARDLGLTPEALRKLAPGESSAYAVAVRQLLVDTAGRVREAQAAYRSAPTVENLIAFQKAAAEYQVTMLSAAGHAAEAGRTLNAYKVAAEAARGLDPVAEVYKPVREAVNPRSREFGAKNTLFPKTEADAALDRIKAALAGRGGDRLRSGVDPTGGRLDNIDVADLLTVGGHLLEGGLRAFPEWAQAMQEKIGATMSEGRLQATWANLRAEVAGRVERKALSDTFVDQLGRRLGREGAAKFVNAIGGTEDTSTLDALLSGADLSPDQQRAVQQAFLESQPERAKGAAAAGPMATVNELAKQARQEAAEASRAVAASAKPVPAPPTVEDVFNRGLRQRLGKPGAAAFRAALDPETTKALLDGSPLTPEQKAAVDKAYREAQPARTAPAAPTGPIATVSDIVAEAKAERVAAEKASRPAPSPWDAFTRTLTARLGKEGADAMREALKDPDGGETLLRRLANGKPLTDAERAQVGEALEANRPARTASTPSEAAQALADIVKETKKRQTEEAKAAQAPPTPKELALKVLLEDGRADADRIAAKVAGLADDDIAGLSRVMREEANIPVMQKLVSLWKAGLLSSPRTISKVLLAHGISLVADDLTHLPSAVVDAIAGHFSGNGRTVEGLSPGAIGKAGLQAATQGVRESLAILRHGEQGAERLGQLQNIGSTSHSGLFGDVQVNSRIGQAYIDTVTRAHSAAYRTARLYAFTRSMQEQAGLLARREGLTGDAYTARVKALLDAPPEDMAATAAANAERAVYLNRNQLTEGLREGLAKRSPGVKAAAGVLMPFAKVGSNIALRFTEYSIGSLTSLAGLLLDTRAGKFDAAAQERFSRTFGRGAVGLGAIALGAKLASQGLATGYSKKRGDVPEGSVKIGGRWYQVSNLAPIGPLLAVGATLHEQAGKGSFVGNFANAAAHGIQENPISRMAETVGSANDLGKALSHQAGSVVPQGLADLAAQMDSHKRKAAGPVQVIESRLPVVRQGLQALPTPETNKLFDPTNSVRAHN